MEDEVVQHEMSDNLQRKTSSFFHATFNCLNAILGLSFLTTPYALNRSGWLGLTILLVFSVISCYTAYLLGRCVTNEGSYNAIAETAFGSKARLPLTLLVQFQLVAILVGYTISMGDNLARLFPHAVLELLTIEIGPPKLLLLLTFFIILPTVWLRNLAVISYVALLGIFTYVIITITVIYTGVKYVGFRHSVPLLRPENLLSVSGIYAFCFAAHSQIPGIYRSLKHPTKYSKVLIVSFIISTMVDSGFAFLGATMFGDAIRSQVSLNIPTHLIVAKVVLWLVVFIAISKYSLCIATIAFDIERRFPWSTSSAAFIFSSILLRTTLIITIFLLAMVFPYFETLVAFIGSASGMLLTVIFPSLFYLRIHGKTMPTWETIINYIIIGIGVAAGTAGTIVSVINFVHHVKK